jgi:P-type Ca2+ transporter type 2C
MNFHARPLPSLQKEFGSSFEQGLGLSQVKANRLKYGPNVLPRGKKTTILKIILNQFSDLLIIILVFAAILSAILGEVEDSLTISFIILLNAIVGVIQEYKAEKALDELKKMVIPFALVIRNGQKEKILSEDLVPGDIVLLEAGDGVPADLRLYQANAFKVDEASLTGESLPVEKNAEILLEEDTVLAEQLNMAFKGTNVTFGKAVGIVIATGGKTQFGKIAHLLAKEKMVQTPLQRRLHRFAKNLTYILALLCLVVFALGVFKGGEPMLMFLTAVSLAVAAIPEALPSVMTVGLALGAKRLARKKALVQRLPAVEALGSVTTICSDKTGTLTQNKIHAEKFFIENQKLTSSFWRAVILNNDSIQKENEFLGEPTEIALYQLAQKEKADRDEIFKQFPRFQEYPFDSTRKMMSTIHHENEDKGENIFFTVTKGAPEVLLPLCSREDLLENVEELASRGLRVLAYAQRTGLENTSINQKTVESNLEFLGLVGLIDPPREEAAFAVSQAKKAGIRPIMITGDHPLTAEAIAKRVGIVDREEDLVISGKELSQLSDQSLIEKMPNLRVFARTSPEQKIRIVKILQSLGEHVAMTGDGVNDAPALKRADIGVAMGITGTHVAKEAAAMTLLDDNFATIVKAIEEGRRIFDNIKKFISFALSGNVGEIVSILFAPLFGLPIPLLPIHILWVNLVTDGLPGLALANEVSEEGTMTRPPRDPKEDIITRRMKYHIFFYGLLIGLLTLVATYIGLQKSEKVMHTMTFSVLTLAQLFLVMQIRFEKVSAFNLKKNLANTPIHLAFYSGILLQLAVIYWPWAQTFFKTTALNKQELLICFSLSFVVFIVKEIEKFYIRSKA